MEDLTVVFIFRKKNSLQICTNPKFAVKHVMKKIIQRKTVTSHLLALQSKSTKSYDSRWAKHFRFLFFKNDAAVKLRIKVNTYLPLDYQLFYKLNLRTVFAYDCSCNITILLDFSFFDSDLFNIDHVIL